jgi:chromosome segregation protein
MKMTIEMADQNKKDQESSKEEMSAKITDLKVTIAQTNQMLDNKNDSIKRLHLEMQENDEERKLLDHELQQLFTLLAERDAMEAEYKAELDKHRGAKNESTQAIEQKKGERNQIHLEMEELENSAKQFRKELRQVEDELHKEVVKENRFEVELDNLLEKLREEYELTFEAAKEEYPAPSDEDVTLVRQDVFRLKRDITALGDVNIGAIEEYDRLKERHEFLSSQSEDLRAAKISLYQVIHEMDQEMKKRFIESFEQISHHFRIVFTQLFGGGRADLILTDPDHLLDTGIEIVAQPPGKKLQNLALLSGGERALTAIALLFAILRVRPVPFCVLDEVEAALDDANVYRYASYLKEFSSETQFIVITHRKGTMEGADVLYGVTMEGSGVSKLVSVKLDEFEKKKAEVS